MKPLLAALLLLTSTCYAQVPRGSSLRALYVDDQRDRGVPLADDGVSMLAKEEADKLPVRDWAKEVPKRDETRREQARQLIAKAGRSGEEYYYAAYLFQHGQKADDYLFAHVLAIEAIALGYGRAKWISASSLDRYLQQIGQKQIFGTQYQGENLAYYLEHQRDPDVVEKFKKIGNQQTLQPYAPQILSDTIRSEFCVPPLTLQEQHIADVKAGKVKPGELPRIDGCVR